MSAAAHFILASASAATQPVTVIEPFFIFIPASWYLSHWASHRRKSAASSTLFDTLPHPTPGRGPQNGHKSLRTAARYRFRKLGVCCAQSTRRIGDVRLRASENAQRASRDELQRIDAERREQS